MALQTHVGRPARSRPGVPSGWPVAVALLLIGVIPLSAGSLRLVELAGGPALLEPDHRFDGPPWALITHVVGSGVYVLVGVLQFLPRFRRRHRLWHRRAGRVLTVAGLLVAASALWMTLLYPARADTGPLLLVFRLLFGSAMAVCLVLGFTAIRRRDVRSHRAWMIRAFALALAAGTQAFTEGLGEAVLGDAVVTTDLLKGAGWVINLAVAEWAVRRVGSSTGRGPRPGGAALVRARAS